MSAALEREVITQSQSFFKLLNKLQKKKVRYQHHLSFLQACQARNIIPEGLKLHKTANISDFSGNFRQKWKQILTDASKDMRDLIKEEYATALTVVEQAIIEEKQAISKVFGVSVLDNFCQKSHEFCEQLEHYLNSKRSGKLRKLFLLQDEGRSTNSNGSSHLTKVNKLVTGVGREINEKRPCIKNEEELGAEESLSGFSSLSVDSRELMIEKEKQPCDIESTFSVDQLAQLLVELVEGPDNNDASPNLNKSDSLSGVASPNDPTENVITTDQRIGDETPVFEHYGMGQYSNNERVFSDGLQIVVNLSNRILTPAETSLLSKGLSFCPTPRDIDIFALRKDISDYVRRLRLKEYFFKKDVGGVFSSYPAFSNKSTWCPERNRDLILETYISMLEKKIFSSSLKARCHRNISRDEQKALENLRSYNDIIIKQADKGSAVVIMDRGKYVAEAMRQLNDDEVYSPLSYDPTVDMIKIVNERVEKLYNDGYISLSTLEYLLVNNDAKAGRFYLLPKIHKKNCPGRPVISGCSTPTEKISAFVDSQLKPLVSQIPSFVKDTNHFLSKLKDMGTFPDRTILVTIDVVGLYPHIPHDEGLKAVRKALDNRCDSKIPTNDIVDLVELVLKNNNFVFDGKHYLQKRGTAIGTRMAPSYANLFMHDLESELLSWAPVKPFIWLRYIDDVFMVWTEGEEKLLEFLEIINHFHETIKFTFDWSRDSINYLDVQVINKGGVIETDLYTKPTDKHQYLYHTSCHPRGCKRSIPYSQALRLKRICSTPALFDKRAKELTHFLVDRGYQKKFVCDQIQKVRCMDRDKLIKRNTQPPIDRVPFIVTYHPNLPNIGGFLRELHPILQLSDRCSQAVPNVPMMAFRRPKNLQDYLVRAKLRPPYNNNRKNIGNVHCKSSRCDVCNYIVPSSSFTSHTTKRSYTINYRLDCNSINVVYLITCKVCGLQYVGSTSTKFRLRFNNHKSRLRAHSRKSYTDRDSDDFIYKHFHGPGHHGLQDVSVQIIDKVHIYENLVVKEGEWAYRLHTLKPEGLNDSDFFYSQNRVTRKR